MSNKFGSVSLGYMDDDDSPVVFYVKEPNGSISEHEELADAVSLMKIAMVNGDKGIYSVIDSHGLTHEITRKW
jgi:hypothetical protein